MKFASLKVASGLLMAATLAFVTPAKAVSFNYSSADGALIQFAGNGTFGFTAPPNFTVTSGTAIGFGGSITTPGGGYVIGAIAANQAPVTGMGTFTIQDGATPLTAQLVWNTISQMNAVGGLNVLASLNLTNITYLGGNGDLMALKNDGSGINTLSFQFTTSYTLQQLKDNQISNSFSGTVTSARVPDGGTTAVLLGVGLVAMGVIARRRLS